MEQEEYKYTFNNLKTELKGLDIKHLKAKLKEQQQELMKRTIELMGGSKLRMNYTVETKFNKEAKDGHNKLVKNS